MNEFCDNGAIVVIANKSIIDIIIPIISAVVGASISGLATYIGLKWQYERGEKRKLITSTVEVLANLQSATSSNFTVSNIEEAEKAIFEVVSAYAACLNITETSLIYFPPYVSRAIEKYRKLTHHNIVVWHGKLLGDEIYKDDRLVPLTDQTCDDGKAKKAYDSARASISKYAHGK